MDATVTYVAPGKRASPLSRGGASEARVDVKECSREKSESMVALTLVSAARTLSWRNSRAWPTWTARRSVGVGRDEVDSEADSLAR